MAMAMKQQILEPEWVPWNGEAYAVHFRGTEITPHGFRKSKAPITTHKADFALPPLSNQRVPPPDHGLRPPAPFEHTTSHRADFCEHKLSKVAQRRPDPTPQFKPKLSRLTTANNDYKLPALPPRAAPHPNEPMKPSKDPTGTTTMRADFCQWKLPSAVAKQEAELPRQTKFHARATTRCDYPWPAEMPPPRPEPPTHQHVVPSMREHTTETRAAYGLASLVRAC